MFNNFADRLFVLCRLRNVTHLDIAKTAGVSISAVNAWKCRGSIPRYNVLSKLAKEYNCSLDWLMGDAALESIEEANND